MRYCYWYWNMLIVTYWYWDIEIGRIGFNPLWNSQIEISLSVAAAFSSLTIEQQLVLNAPHFQDNCQFKLFSLSLLLTVWLLVLTSLNASTLRTIANLNYFHCHKQLVLVSLNATIFRIASQFKQSSPFHFHFQINEANSKS